MFFQLGTYPFFIVYNECFQFPILTRCVIVQHSRVFFLLSYSTTFLQSHISNVQAITYHFLCKLVKKPIWYFLNTILFFYLVFHKMHNFVLLFLGTTFDYSVHNNNYSYFFLIYTFTHYTSFFYTFVLLQLSSYNLKNKIYSSYIILSYILTSPYAMN